MSRTIRKGAAFASFKRDVRRFEILLALDRRTRRSNGTERDAYASVLAEREARALQDASTLDECANVLNARDERGTWIQRTSGILVSEHTHALAQDVAEQATYVGNERVSPETHTLDDVLRLLDEQESL